MTNDTAPRSLQGAEGPSEYSGLVQLFIELRGRGMSLSSQDLEIIREWQSENIAVESVARVMLDMANEQRERTLAFPSTLAPVARRVKKLRKQLAEF